MFIKALKDCDKIIAGDNTILRELLNPDKAELKIRYSLAHARVHPGKSSAPHILKTSEVYYILKGDGIMHIDDEAEGVTEGHAVYIPPDSIQHIENTGEKDLDFLCIVDPAWQPKDEHVL